MAWLSVAICTTENASLLILIRRHAHPADLAQRRRVWQVVSMQGRSAYVV